MSHQREEGLYDEIMDRQSGEGAAREALGRAAVLLDAVVRFMAANGLAQEMTVVYDQAECDGACLAEDCKITRDDIVAALEPK